MFVASSVSPNEIHSLNYSILDYLGIFSYSESLRYSHWELIDVFSANYFYYLFSMIEMSLNAIVFNCAGINVME